ncbi:SMP-30/gluconolactonase/LRE family protein [Nesterenkonia sp. CF4.4]|uniref:SMP-30/gluconolactonase/LRE family protein n=1 Tax=Nesterenkonia sp. CF4.4 TaxID=3373079 RepID=UPI003EE6A17A
MAGSEFEHRGSWSGDPTVFHGEGGYWDAGAGVFRYVDMYTGDIVTLEGPDTTRTHLSALVAMMRGRRAGGYVVAVERGFRLLGEDFRPEQYVTAFDDGGLRMNEGSCDPAGRLYCGSMAYEASRGAGVLYRLDPDLRVHRALEGVSIPNGLVWIEGGHTALHADTMHREIRAYEVDPSTGEFGTSRIYVSIPEGHGAPDGMALDSEGCLWVAMWGGAAVHRYAPDGTLTEVLSLPVTNPTSCTFGGKDGSTLFVTTSKENADAAAEPLAGQVFTRRVDASGAPVHEFGG